MPGIQAVQPMRFLRPRGRGSLVGLQSPGYQLISGKVDEYAQYIAGLTGHMKDRAEATLRDARTALENRIWHLVPYPKYDYVWALLHEIRHLLCQEVPLQRVVAAVVDEIAGDLDYLAPDERAAARTGVKHLRQGCLDLLEAKDESAKRPQSHEQKEAKLRAEIESYSKRVALAREGHWLKVNMTRNRIFLTGLMLAALLCITVRVLPRAIGTGEDTLSERVFWGVVLFGAMGGVMSALMGNEALSTRASIFYVRRRLLYLRPVVGGTLALLAYLAFRSGAIDFPALTSSTSLVFGYVLAFVAGFSERVFITRIVSVIGGHDRDQDAAGDADSDAKKPNSKRGDGAA